jgi:hypothetical protein
MLSGLKRAATVVLAGGMLIGCTDDRAADKKVRATLAQARQAAVTGTPAETLQLLSTAASTEGASDGMIAVAKGAQAQNELEQANRIILDIERKEMELRRVVFEITQLAVQIRASGSAADGYRQFDPKAAREKIAEKIAEAQGGPGKPTWFTHGNSTIPTLSAIKQDVSRLEGEITQLQEQIKNVTSQRDAFMDDAEKASAQAEQLKGREAVDVFKKSSDLRKQAGEKSIELDKLTSQLARLERDLSIAKGQESILNEVVAGLQAQSSQLEAGWKQVDTHIARQKQLAAEILGTASATSDPTASADPKSKPIADKAVELDQLVKELETLRGEALPLLDSAIKHFSDAYEKATAYSSMLQGLLTDPKNENRPERVAWEGSKNAIAPFQYRFQQAGAQRVLGTLHASHATSLANRISLRDMANEGFKLAGLTVPPSINDPSLQEKLQKALGLADEAYKESDELLTNIVDGQAAESLRANARLSRAITLYDWSVVERMVKKDESANAHVTAAKADRDFAAEFGLPIPAMPVELGPPPKKELPQPTPEVTAETPAASPEQAAIEAMLKSLGEALQAGDIETARSMTQIEAGQEAVWDQIVTIATESKKLEAAVKEKFGEQASGATPQMGMPGATPIPGGAITVTGDEASVQGPGMSMKLFVRVDGQWKLFIGAPASEPEQAIRAVIEKLATSLPTITADIQSGKIATQEDLNKAMMELVGSILGAMGGAQPTPGPTPPPQ